MIALINAQRLALERSREALEQARTEVAKLKAAGTGLLVVAVECCSTDGPGHSDGCPVRVWEEAVR